MTDLVKNTGSLVASTALSSMCPTQQQFAGLTTTGSCLLRHDIQARLFIHPLCLCSARTVQCFCPFYFLLTPTEANSLLTGLQNVGRLGLQRRLVCPMRCSRGSRVQPQYSCRTSSADPTTPRRLAPTSQPSSQPSRTKPTGLTQLTTHIRTKKSTHRKGIDMKIPIP